MFGGGDNQSKQRPKYLGVDPDQVCTAEHGRPVPYFAGTRRLGVTFISEPWNIYSQPVTAKVGKRKATVGYNYFCSFAAAVCLGPVDQINRIILDDQTAWEGPIQRDDQSVYEEIAIPGRGLFRFYWGTDEQVADPTANASGTNHPGYRGLCYVVGINFLIGQDRVSLGNLQFDLARYPVVYWLETGSRIEDEAHPIAVFGDLWANHRYGLGLSAAYLDKPALNAVAATINEEGIGISPLITELTDFREVFEQLLSYFDGYLTRGVDGKIGIGLVRPMTGDEPVIDEDDLTEPPELGDEGWDATYDMVTVRFENAAKNWEGDSVSWVNRGTFEVTRATRTNAVDRTWVTSAAVALNMAMIMASRQGLPKATADLKVLRASAMALTPGAAFFLSYANSGIALLPMRVVEWALEKPDALEVSIRAEQDQSHLNSLPLVVDPDDPLPEVILELVPLAFQYAVELPYGFTRSRDPWLLFFAVRDGRYANNWNLHWERAPGSYTQQFDSNIFARKGHLGSDYPAAGGSSVAADIVFDGDDNTLPEVLEDEASGLNRLLMFVGAEIVSLYGAALVSGGRYRSSGLRGRFGTEIVDHASGEAVWIVEQVTGYALPKWQAPLSPSPLTFKLQPCLFNYEVPLEECEELDVTLRHRAATPATPANLRVFGDGVNPTYTTSGDIVADWDQTSEERQWTDPIVDVETRASGVVLQAWVNGAKAGEWAKDETGSATIMNADLVAALGSEVSFELRIYNVAGTHWSDGYDSVNVWKV